MWIIQNLVKCLSLTRSCWPAHDRGRRSDTARSTTILQDARSLAAASHPCRHPISDRSRFTWSSHRVCCAPLRHMPKWGSLSNTFLVGHESGILMTCPAIVSCQPSPSSGCSVRRTAQQARGLSFSSTLHARTHRQRWSGGCVAQTCPDSPATRYLVFVTMILNPILAASRLSRMYASHTFAVVLAMISM